MLFMEDLSFFFSRLETGHSLSVVYLRSKINQSVTCFVDIVSKDSKLCLVIAKSGILRNMKNISAHFMIWLLNIFKMNHSLYIKMNHA